MSDVRHVPPRAASLGEAIRLLRQDRGMTLRALAKEAGVTPAFLSDLEKNRRNTERLDKFSAALGVPVEELRELDGRVPIELKEWLQANPSLLALLRELRASGRPVPVDALRASLRLSRG